MDSSPSEYQPCPLQFYEFQQLDSSMHCPVYTDILKHQGGAINVESIEALQSELIALQDSVKSRIGLLESEVMVLDNWQVKRDYRKRKHSDGGDSRGQRSETPLKKAKLEEKKKTKSKKIQHEVVTPGEQHSVKVKGDAPDRFWASVEPYCADLTDNDLKLLQNGIKNQENDNDVYSVPPLGTHYSRRWASHDIHQEREVSARLGQLADPFTDREGDTGQWPDESDHMLKYADSAQGKQQYGPLTERLIAAFLEDPNGAVKSTAGQLQLNTQQPSTVSVDTLENRIKHELIVLGLFNAEDEKQEADEEDEILAELKKKQEELKSISEYNLAQRQTLYKLAKQEIRRQDMRQTAKEADEEVMSWLTRIINIKQKRKGALSRKEKESAWRALQHREDIQRKMNHKL